MVYAGFKDLCMDADDALARARFRAAVLGAPLVAQRVNSARQRRIRLVSS